jgi:uncharacterized protein with HEPN domain
MWRDDAYLLDMLLAARKIMKYARELILKDLKRMKSCRML